MAIITVKTQQELDALPKSFSEYTIIRIESQKGVWISVAEKRDNSTVKALGNSTVEAWDNSTVEAWDNSTVKALGNSTVKALGNSTVKALGNSTVEALGNSTVEAWDNSTVKALGNSTVEAWDNSTVKALGNSTVELFISAYVIVLSSRVIVKKLLDFSTAVFKGCKENILEKSDTASSREIPAHINPSFDEWLRRGYVSADGMIKKLKSQKKIGEIEVFEVFEFPKKETSFVVKRGETFSHGATIEKAIEDLRYKISDRDTSKFAYWKSNLDKEISVEESIQAYRTITGACEFGTKQFVDSIKIPEKLTPKIILNLTSGHFGNEKLREFLEV